MTVCAPGPVDPSACVTCLAAYKGLLWVGTSVGVVLTLTLPRLEGVPQVKERPRASYHAHAAPVRFLVPLSCAAVQLPGLLAPPPQQEDEEDDLSMLSEGSDPPPDRRYMTLEAEPPSRSEGAGPGSLTLGSKPWLSVPDLRPLPRRESVEDVAALYGQLLDTGYDDEVLGARRATRRQLVQRLVTSKATAVQHRLSRVVSKPGDKYSTLAVVPEGPTPPEPVISASTPVSMLSSGPTKHVMVSGGEGHVKHRASSLTTHEPCLLLWQYR